MTVYTQNGKQILRNGDDYAQACSVDAAAVIVAALNAWSKGELG
jgi:hypothetical protein